MTTATIGSPSHRQPELLRQTVVVIGGSAGIGLEVARRARAEGADVILAGRDPERLQLAASELGALSSPAFDATDPGSLARPTTSMVASSSFPASEPQATRTDWDVRGGIAQPRREPDTDANLRRVNMSSTDASSEATTRIQKGGPSGMRLEVAVALVSDVDHARTAR